jgi:hypothetical protein
MGVSFLASLRGGKSSGTSQAALRVLLAIAAADERLGTSWEVQLSLDDLEGLTGLSRSLVVRGLKTATSAGLITYVPGKPRTKSTLGLVQREEAKAGGWAKLPVEMVLKKLPRVPHRGDVGLAALKIYLVLLAARPNANTVVSLKHDTLRSKTGCQARHVRPAISLLANEGLIHVIRDEDISDSKYRVQQYQICGKLDARPRWDEPRSAPSTDSTADLF